MKAHEKANFLTLAGHVKNIVKDNGLAWRQKYELIFSGDVSKPLIALGEKMGGLTWVDPGTTYEEDVKAFASAVEEMAEAVRKIPHIPRMLDSIHQECGDDPPEGWCRWKDLAPILSRAFGPKRHEDWWNWVKNPTCKYINVRIDMRTGVCRLEDGDGNHITVEQLAKQEGGEYASSLS